MAASPTTSRSPSYGRRVCGTRETLRESALEGGPPASAMLLCATGGRWEVPLASWHVTYEVDASDRLLTTGGAWRSFALENDAPEIADDAVLGRPIWSFLAGAEIHSLYREVFAWVRTSERAFELEGRCDGPNDRRSLRLEIVPRADGRLGVASHVVEIGPRLHCPLLDRQISRSSESWEFCGICNRVEGPPGAWSDIEEASSAAGIEFGGPVPTLSPGLCGTCRAAVSASLGPA